MQAELCSKTLPRNFKQAPFSLHVPICHYDSSVNEVIMKYGSLMLVLGLLYPVITLAQNIVTVRVDTGTCAPSHVTNSLYGSAAGYGGIASGSQGLTVLSSASNGIAPISTASSSSSVNSTSSTTTWSSTTINNIPSVVVSGSALATSSA